MAFRRKLQSLNEPLEKLEFVYDYIYNNTHKNRFALFEDSDFKDCKLYKDESKIPLKTWNLTKLSIKILHYPLPNEIRNSVILRVQNMLSYKLGKAMIANSKSLKGLIKLPFILNKIAKDHKRKEKFYKVLINFDSKYKNLDIKKCFDYDKSLFYKEHLSYKLGFAL
ncbi:hypothetical protein FMM55_06965 [Campylobacter sp. LR196d]|uniref:hypothetical protein n=1 Tax=Campylobacter sp. LR196d TaxID=2593543 RepID=UPI00123C22A0|nr:hypothetical protein [Campylobacter sp. LR196d]KAA6225539.1 hypothetical protein FMM55_06965 [Campylobacter sp. LR196d]